MKRLCSRPVFALVVGAVFFSLFSASCGVPDSEPETVPPDGILSEMQSDKSITTDVNARSPAFARTANSGKVIKTQDYVGRGVLLLDFWSVFCQSCLKEIPFLTELHERYHEQGLEIISVNTDFFPSTRIMSFMEKTGLNLPYPLILDRDQSLSRLFQVEALPVTVLIDSEGWIRMVHLGYRDEDRDTIESRVRKACRRIRETVVTLQPVQGRTAFAPPEKGASILAAGSRMEAFAAVDEGGREKLVSPGDNGSPALVFFWSLFCKPCREEFGMLGDLQKRYSSRGLEVIAVNVDSPKLRASAFKFMQSNGQGLTSVFDSTGEDGLNRIAPLFGVTYTPSTFLVSAEGVVLSSFSGEVPAGELEKSVAALFAEESATGGEKGGGR